MLRTFEAVLGVPRCSSSERLEEFCIVSKCPERPERPELGQRSRQPWALGCAPARRRAEPLFF
eukprot:9376904-Alexandrium_andersonii.AAC.1